MPATVVVPIVAEDVVLGVAECPDPFELSSAQVRREFPVLRDNPWPMAAGCPEPSPVTEEVVVAPDIEEIVRHAHCHVKAEPRGIDEIHIVIDGDYLGGGRLGDDDPRRRRCGRCGDDDLLGLIAQVEIEIYPDIAGAGGRRAEHQNGWHKHHRPAGLSEPSEHNDTLLEKIAFRHPRTASAACLPGGEEVDGIQNRRLRHPVFGAKVELLDPLDNLGGEVRRIHIA